MHNLKLKNTNPMLVHTEKLIEDARKKQLELNSLQDAIFSNLKIMDINIDEPTEAENADSLSEAITCYIHYGEYGLNNVIKEIKNQCRKGDKNG